MHNYKLGITQWGMPGEGLYAIRIAKEAGLDGIQIELGSYENGYPMAQKCVRDKYLEDAIKHGIEFPSLVLNDLGVYGFVHGKNTDKGKIAYEMMNIGINVAAEMKIDTVMIPNFFDNFIIEEDHYKNAADALVFCCDLAARHGIVIASETVLSPENHFRLLDMVDRKNIGIFFDSMNYKFFSKFDQMEVLQKAWSRIVPQLHVKDGVKDLSGSLLGEGEMDFIKQAEFIAKSDYSGWIILENYYSHLPLRKSSTADQLTLLKQDIATVKKVFNN